MVDIKNIPVKLKNDCRFCVWKFEKRSGQKTKMPYNPATSERAKINDLRTFADFKTTLMTYAMGGFDGIGIAVGNGIGAFDIDHCIREDGTLNDTAATVLSIFPTAYVEKSPSGQGLRGFFCVPEDYVFDKTVYYINNRSKGLEVYMPGATNRFVTVTGDVYRTGEIPNDPEAMTTLLDSLMKRSKQVQNNQLRHHSYLSDDAVIVHAEEAGNSDKFKKLYAGDWQELYDSQSDADMAMLSILAFWCGCDEEQMDRIFRTSGLMRDKWDRKQAGTTYGAISIRNAVNTAVSVYVPVNAQDIVDEEFSSLDPEAKNTEYQPDISKLTLSLEEMAPHTNPRYGRDEIGMGNMFADFFKPIARYNSERGIWYVYDGKVWQPDMENLKVAELAKLLADKLYVFALTITEEDTRKRFIDRVKKLQLRKHRETMLKDAKSVFPLSMRSFDSDIYLFNCQNGTLNLRTMEFREHRPEDYLTKVSPAVYDPEADCPRWRIVDKLGQMKNTVSSLGETFKKLTGALGSDSGGGLLSKLGDLVSQLGSGKSSGIISNFGNLISGLTSKMGGLGQGISGVLSKLGSLGSSGSGILSSLGSVASGVLSKLGGVGSGLSGILSGVGSSLGGIAASAGSALTGLFGSVGTTVSGLAAGAGSALAGIASSAGGFLASAGTALAGVAGPAGIAVAAVAGVGLGVKALWDNCDSFRDGVTNIWNGIKNTFASGVAAVKQGVANAASFVGNIASSIWGGVKNVASSAWNWGKDIVSGIAGGIQKGVSWVGNAVKSVASGIRSFLHFSVPDEGPLADADTYMPDFMQLMAKGIRGSTGNVLDSVKTLVGKVHEGMADISTFRLPEVNIPQFNANGWNTPQPALAGGTTRTTNLGGVHITVNGYNARNDDELAQIVADKINDMIDQDDSVYK